MQELVYEVKFLSDIVLPATSNTEGNISQLDFIPGSNFLGMVAKYYDDFENRFDMFHSGKVKFGDATLLYQGRPTYKMPLSYFHEKLDETLLYNHHKIEDFKKFTQLKQKRNGYITSDLEVVNIDYDYSQKSAYDKEKRRSKDTQMYGYNAIVSDTFWQFSIKYDNISEHDLKLLKESLQGKQRLGKSKSAQYGRVEIQLKSEKEQIEDTTSSELILYANSRLALVDTFGNPTYELEHLFEGLSKKNIDYDKCQIRTSTFTPYNGVRETKDYERVCIDKGSVIVLKDIEKESIPSFVGAFWSEGFGEILLNPKFLQEDAFHFKESKKDNTTRDAENITKEDKLADFLLQREESKKAKLDLAKEVTEFIKNNPPKQKLNSQWGTIKSLTSRAESDSILYDLLFEKLPEEKPKGYLRSKKAKEKWNSELVEKLENMFKICQNKRIDYREFVKLLSMQMPKIKNSQKEEKKEQQDD